MIGAFTEAVITVIKSIPAGRASTYGTVAEAAGNPRAARQVARILHSCSSSHDLPWHRVVGAGGCIRLKGYPGVLQRGLLESEGVVFMEDDKISQEFLI